MDKLFISQFKKEFPCTNRRTIDSEGILNSLKHAKLLRNVQTILQTRSTSPPLLELIGEILSLCSSLLTACVAMEMLDHPPPE